MARLTFSYRGSAANMLSEILALVPDPDRTDKIIHSSIELFGGTGIITLNKQRHRLEVINELNGEITNFFEQLRTHSDELIRLIKLTPYSRNELEKAYMPTTDPLEAARRFYTRQMQSRNGTQKSPHWRRQMSLTVNEFGTPNMTPVAKTYAEADYLYDYAERLRGVFIENGDALEIFDEYDNPHALFIIDPPFLPVTRKNKNGLYGHEMTEKQHEALVAKIANNLQGYAIIRHYACELYDLAFSAWQKIQFDKRVDGANSQQETLYVSPNLASLNAIIAAVDAEQEKNKITQGVLL